MQGGADAGDAHAGFARDALSGLSQYPKSLPAKYFYDRQGALLFEEITAIPEYYQTRTELAILEREGAALAAAIPPSASVVEFGSGSTRKVRRLLAARPDIRTYVPVDLSAEFLCEEARALAADYPSLAVRPVVADISRPFDLPESCRTGPVVGFFPGSTIGNFDPDEAEVFLENAGSTLGDGARLILGFDLVKDAKVLHAAYDDAAGVTARFNKNILLRMNRELGADFNPEDFDHFVRYDDIHDRIEMYLESRRAQIVTIQGRQIAFARHERIHTENSYKYTINSLHCLVRAAGWTPKQALTDDRTYFCVQILEHAQDLGCAPHDQASRSRPAVGA